MSTNHITPTTGRIVYFRGSDGNIRAAIVTAVHGDYCVNLRSFGIDAKDSEVGQHDSVTHADPEQEPGCFPSWHWMPYQKEQAAKHAATNENVGGVVGGEYDEKAYIQRHQREQALHLAISARAGGEDPDAILKAAAQFLAFMQGGA